MVGGDTRQHLLKPTAAGTFSGVTFGCVCVDLLIYRHAMAKRCQLVYWRCIVLEFYLLYHTTDMSNPIPLDRRICALKCTCEQYLISGDMFIDQS